MKILVETMVDPRGGRSPYSGKTVSFTHDRESGPVEITGILRDAYRQGRQIALMMDDLFTPFVYPGTEIAVSA